MTMTDTLGDNSRSALVRFVERIERLEEEKAVIGEDIKEVYSEAKGDGFDAATMRKVIRLRKMDPQTRKEQEAMIATYEAALDQVTARSGDNES